ncbi:hypothetical protein LSAT2_002790 [Lamellibrachia satsuma]|nr:hypothetical protein LSAT2_002790 [Lamellibrachia satsuma]
MAQKSIMSFFATPKRKSISNGLDESKKTKAKPESVSEETSPTNEQATEDGSPVKAVVRRKGARQIIDSDDSEDEGVAMETSISEESPAVSNGRKDNTTSDDEPMPPSHTTSNGKKDNATSDDEPMSPSHTASNSKKDKATSDDEPMPPSHTASNGKNNATSDDESMPPPSVTASPYNIPLRKTARRPKRQREVTGKDNSESKKTKVDVLLSSEETEVDQKENLLKEVTETSEGVKKNDKQKDEKSLGSRMTPAKDDPGVQFMIYRSWGSGSSRVRVEVRLGFDSSPFFSSLFKAAEDDKIPQMKTACHSFFAPRKSTPKSNKVDNSSGKNKLADDDMEKTDAHSESEPETKKENTDKDKVRRQK